jgi:tryptophan synthase beta subunit
LSSFTGQLTPCLSVESGWSSPGIGPKCSVFRASERFKYILLGKRNNTDYSIAFADELVKRFDSPIPRLKQAHRYESNHRSGTTPLLRWRIVR